MTRRRRLKTTRRGAVLPLVAILLIVLLGLVAFAVDVGYILVAKNQAQNGADAASLAAAAKLVERLKSAPIVNGIPLQTANDLALAREEAKAFARGNHIGSQTAELQDSDIEIGYLANPYDQTNNTLDTSGWPTRPYNAVRVAVRRDQNNAHGPLNLFFAPAMGIKQANVSVTATAVFVMGTPTPRGNQGEQWGGLLPFTYQVDQWKALLGASQPGQVTAANGATVTLTDGFTLDGTGVTSGSDGSLETCMFPDSTTSGNFGTINFSKSKTSNSTSVLRDLIASGPDQADWPDLPDIVKASPASPVAVNGDPGISAGMESAVQGVVGETRILPLYSTVSGNGNNSYYQIVDFAPVTIVDVSLNGGTKYIKIQPKVTKLKSKFDGTHEMYFDITPSENPDPLFIGTLGLVR